MEKTFNKSVPDELYIDSFAQSKTISFSYTGPETLKVVVDKIYGGVQYVAEPGETPIFNPELSILVEVDANADTDIAHYLTNTSTPDREFETETLPGNKTYEKLTNPTLKDYYNINYSVADNAWQWTLITRNPRTSLNDLADKYKQYIETNVSKIAGNTELLALSNTYLNTLQEFNTTGIGSIPSWKFIEMSLADVPAPPSQLVVAFNVLP